ncbi:MAG TPA: universal stress protein [Streptosporangiaceae bacterium]|nr:universal stress protein [Streptosporangiaceae bacterium]
MTARTADGRRQIVVGVDGSAASKAALAWAISQARLTGAAVEAVEEHNHASCSGRHPHSEGSSEGRVRPARQDHRSPR